MRKKLRNHSKKRILALILGAATLFGTLPGVGLPAFAAEELPYVKAEKGVWITEIYQNDVNRSAVYTTASDVMEYVEIMNTGDAPVLFNETYTLWYEYLSDGKMITQSNPLTITTEDQAQPEIGPGETVLIRVARPDLPKEQYPSNDDFRKTLDAAPDVKIWQAAGQNGWAENARGCSIRLKADKNTILSRFIYNFSIEADGTVVQKTDDVTQDGLSVQLQIPDYGYEMLAWGIKTKPSPGHVYEAQLNGQMRIEPPTAQPEGLYLTEVLPQDASGATGTRFGSGGNQILEFIELTNTTDHDIDLNKEYQISYSSKTNNGIRSYAGGNERALVITQPSDPYNNTCIIPAGQSAVIWIHREESNTAFLLDQYGFTMPLLTQRENAAPGVTTIYDTFPTEAEFREIRGIADDVPVFTCRNINGCGNDRNTFAVRKILNPEQAMADKITDGYDTALVSYYSYDTAIKKDTSGGRSAQLSVSAEGPFMTLYQAAAVPTPGTVAAAQLQYRRDDGETPVFYEWADAPVPASINQGDIFRTPYYYENVRSVELYYRVSNADSFVKTVSTSFSIFNKWYTFIPADALLHADYFDFYIKANGASRTTQTEMKRVMINKLDEADGLRVSQNGETIGDAAAVSGAINITAKNFEDANAPVSIALDGATLPVAASLEKGAFFSFTHDGGNGLDSYFKNALVVKENEDDDFGDIIRLFPNHSETPGLASQAILVDSRFFHYNADGSATVDLYIYAGTYGSTFENFTAENNDDFTAQWVRLSLPDGTTYKPTEYKGFRVTSGADGAGTQKVGWFDLDPDAQIRVGDSNNLHVYVKSAFTIPAAQTALDAVSTKIDTTALSDGEHTLTVTSGNESRTILLTVDNSEPIPAIPEPLPGTDLPMTIDTDATPVTATVTAGEDDAVVAVYEAKKADITVYEGIGDSTTEAVEKTDNNPTVSDHSEFPYQIYEMIVEGDETDNIRFDITATNDYDRDVQLYALNTATDTWDLLETTVENDAVTAIFPLENRLADGKVKVLVQARGTEYAPYTAPHKQRTEKNDYADEWTGEGEHAVPQQYDFSMAWITDTQYYSEQYGYNFDNIMAWILDNREELNIQYVPHTGDIVDEWDEEYEFINASNQLQKFDDAQMPYGVIGGNHDVAFGAEKYSNYWKYFGEDRFKEKSYYGESYKNNLGHYDLVTVDGEELILIYMSWDVYLPETDWINEVLAQYPDRKAIIAVHASITAAAAPSYQGNLILKEVCAKNPNVFAVINGHYHGSSLNFEGFDDNNDGVDDRVVYQICTDYQSAPGGGNGYIKMIYFDFANDKIYMNSYSPTIDDYNYYDRPKLESYPIGLNIADIDITMLDVDFDRDAKKTLSTSDAKAFVFTGNRLGEADADGATVVPLDGLAGTEAYVYAVATDADGAKTAYSNATPLDSSEIISLRFTDETGTVLTDLSAPTLVTQLTKTNTSAATEALTVIVAIYDPAGKTAHIGTDEKEIPAGETADFNVTLDLPENTDGLYANEGYTAKVFVWDSETLAPVTAAFDFE